MMNKEISIGEIVAMDFRAASVFKEAGIDFSEINRELLQHLKNEEEVFFPAIKEFLLTGSADSKLTIVNQINKLSPEHEYAGGAMDKINSITGNYKVPADGCNTYQLTFRLLEKFEDDLHVHVHLENNILFPKALRVIYS